MDENKNKTRMAVWFYPESWAIAEKMYPLDNCKSKSEYIEKAVAFYTGYLNTKDSAEFLADSLTSVIGGTIHDSENRLARMLFKQAVELSVLTGISAAKLNVSNLDLRELRQDCVDAVKRSNGTINLEKAIRSEQGV